MDTNVTEELKEEGNVREIISKIQTMRKDAGFEVVDRINVFFSTEDEAIKKAFNDANLKAVVLADSVTEGTADGFTKELDVNGSNVTVIVVKVK